MFFHSSISSICKLVLVGLLILLTSSGAFQPADGLRQGRPNLDVVYHSSSSNERTVDFFLKDNEKAINDFCIGTNEFWKSLVIKPVRDYVEIRPAGTSGSDIVSKLIAPPEVPGIPRPVWFTILGSLPTALGWYGYYKFSVEEELYQYEL